MTRVRDILTEVNEKAAPENDHTVLTLTEKNGFVRQEDRFKKRLAREDTTGYKVVRRDHIAFNPYLLWAAAIARNTIVEVGIVSPLYPTFTVNDGYDPGYVNRLLLSDLLVSAYDSIAFGSVPRRRRTSVKDFLALQLPPIPPISEQRRIASILDEADAICTKRRIQVTHLDRLPEALFHQRFTTSMDSFPVVPLGDIASWSSGKFLPSSEQAGGPVPVYGGNGINGTHDRSMYEERRLIVGRVGANCGAVHTTLPNSWVTDNALVANISRTDVDIFYLEYALRFANLNQYSAKSGQPSISGARISGTPIVLPPLEAQQAFAATLATIRDERDNVTTALAADEELFAALEHRAFRGEL